MAADSDSESAMDLQDPDLILLFTWTGAQPHHIAKYTSGYAKIFPSSPIMVITTSLNNLLYRSSAKNKRSLIPAILTILSSHLDSNFLIHCFSESGAHKAIQFAKAFLKSTGRRLPISAVCLDTARGTLNHAKKPQACRTPTKGTPALQTLISLLAYTLAPSSWTTYPTDFSPFLSDSNHTCTFNKSRQALNDPRLWDIHSPRCYLFSTTDKFTHPDSVASHARSAEELGARRVILAQFEELKSSSNGEKYWMTVQQTWDASTSTSSPRTNEKTAYTYVTDIEKQAEIHVLVHELPTQRSPVDCTPESSLEPSPEPPFSASSSIYSSDNDDEITKAPPSPTVSAAPAAPSCNGPAKFCIKKDKRRWYDCLRPVPGYQGWGVGTESFPYERLTRKRDRSCQQRESCQREAYPITSMYQYFYCGI
jgi:hypothetical protein